MLLLKLNTFTLEESHVSASFIINSEEKVACLQLPLTPDSINHYEDGSDLADELAEELQELIVSTYNDAETAEISFATNYSNPLFKEIDVTLECQNVKSEASVYLVCDADNKEDYKLLAEHSLSSYYDVQVFEVFEKATLTKKSEKRIKKQLLKLHQQAGKS